MTKKLKRTYDLDYIKSLIRKKKFIFGRNPTRGASALGYSETEALEIILSLNNSEFCKSESDYNDPKVWHDHYKCERDNKEIFIKFYIATGQNDECCIISSFKMEVEE